MIKKCIAVCIICILMLMTIPSVPSIEIKSTKNVEPLHDFPEINVTLPDAHVYSNVSKFRYADVEFNDTETVIDINISDALYGQIRLCIYQNQYLHVQNQLIPNWYYTYTAIYKNDDFLGSTESNGKFKLSSDWHWNKSNCRFVLNVSRHGFGEYLIRVIIVSLPPWLPFLNWLHLYYDLPDLLGYHPFPNVEIKGGTATYQANIHV